MIFRNLIRNITHKANRFLTSNLEVLNEIPSKIQPTISEIETGGLVGDGKTIRKQERIIEIISFFNSKPSLRDLKNVVPYSHIIKDRATKDKPKMYIVERDVACDIVKVLRPYFETYGGHVMEINAGAGVLTQELFKAGLRNLRIYEQDPDLCNHLLKLIQLYKSDARLFRANLLVLGGLMKLDTVDNEGRIETLFDGLPSLPWEDDPVVKVIGALPNQRFILHVMFSIILQSGLCEFGRPEFFLIFCPEIYKGLKSNPNDERIYHSSSIIFQVLFDHEELARVPDNAFIPWQRKQKTKKLKEISNDLCLVKLSPKRDLLKTIPPDLLRTFIFFVKFLMRKKSGLLVDTMEKWIPGCGIRLISKGYTIFTDCGSLTPEEYLEIYLEFTSWPEFRSSSFLPSAEGVHGRLLQSSLEEKVLSDEKFNRLLTKQSDNPVEDGVADYSTSLEHSDKSDSVEGRSS